MEMGRAGVGRVGALGVGVGGTHPIGVEPVCCLSNSPALCCASCRVGGVVVV